MTTDEDGDEIFGAFPRAEGSKLSEAERAADERWRSQGIAHGLSQRAQRAAAARFRPKADGDQKVNGGVSVIK